MTAQWVGDSGDSSQSVMTLTLRRVESKQLFTEGFETLFKSVSERGKTRAKFGLQ